MSKKKDEFDQLRDRIETLEDELGIESDEDEDITDEYTVWLKVLDGVGSPAYIPVEHVTGMKNTYAETMSNAKVDHSLILCPEGGGSSYEYDWYASDIEIVDGDQVKDEVCLDNAEVITNE